MQMKIGKRLSCALFATLFVGAWGQAAEVISVTQLKTKNITAKSIYALATGSQFKAIKQESNKDGSSYTKSQQMFMGIPVSGYQTVIATDKSNKVNRHHGYIVKGIEKEIKSVDSKLTEQEAEAFAVAYFKKNNVRSSQWVVNHLDAQKVIYIDDSKSAHVTYRVTFLADTKVAGNPFRGIFFVDANDGNVLQVQNAITYHGATGPGGNEKTGKYIYGVDFPKIEVSKSGNTCKFQTKDVSTIDLKNQGSGNPQGDSGLNTNPHEFTCSENTDRPMNGAFSPLNDAQFFGNTVFNMYQDWYGINPLKTSLTLRVHYAKEFENAFWDGKQMTFGDGKDLFYPLVVLDVTAHEVSHGFTEFNSALVYANQSGGMNEAFSDMAGEAAEFYARGSNDWKVGGEVAKELEALRYMDDPTKDGKSIDHVSNFAWSGDTICMICQIMRNEMCASMCTDVHHSSGIYNKVFYMMATTSGWDTRKAFDVFVKANQKYWTESSTFEDGAKGVVDAANDLGYETAPIKKAFGVVGINL